MVGNMADSETTTATGAEESQSLRDALSQAYDSNIKQESPASQDIPAASEPATVAADASAQLSTSANRNEKGQFVSKAAETTPATQPPTNDTTTGDAAKQVTDKSGSEAAPLDPPISWSAEEKQAFRESPPGVQRAILRREQQREAFVNRKSEELSKTQRNYVELDETLAPYKEELNRANVKPSQLVGELLAAHQRIMSDPVEGIRWLAEQNGVDLGQLVATPSQKDPHVARIEAELQQLRQAYVGEREHVNSQRTQAIQQDVEGFAAETDAHGNLLRPHFKDVFEDMIDITRRVKAEQPTASNRAVLEESYNRALRANPRTYEYVREREYAELERKRLDDTRKKADAARLAGSSVSGSPGGGISRAAPETVREALERAWEGNS